MATKEEYLWLHNRMMMAAQCGELLALCRELEKQDDERSDAACEKIIELERELKNAHEAHGIAEQKVDEMLHPKPPSSAEVEGPFRFKWIGASHFTLFEEDQWLIIVTDRSCEMPPERLVRLLNLGVRAEQLQRDAEFCRSQYREQMSRADAAEAREKALRELVERWRDWNDQEGYDSFVMEYGQILAGREPNQPDDQAPEATKP